MRYLRYKLLHTVRRLKYKRISSGVPPLTLQNAVAGKLLNYQIFGNSIQDGVPSVDTPVEVQSVGDKTKNLFNEKNATVLYTNSASRIEYHNGVCKVVAGAAGNSAFALTKICPANNVVGNPVTVRSVWEGSNAGRLQIGYCNENGAERIGLSVIRESGISKTVTIPEEAKSKILCLWLYTDGDKDGYVDYTQTQVEVGLTETSYEPYGYKIPVTVNNQPSNIYLDEPLRKIGDNADYLDFENQKVVRNVDVIDDTGTLPIEQSLQPLATPTEETIELPDIAVQNGTNIIDVDTTVTPSNVEIEYYSKEKE